MSDADFAEGKAFVLGTCLTCGRPFTFNPLTVCSHPWPVPDGPREPICRPCIVGRINPERRRRGLPEFTVLPGAYFDEET